METDIIDVSHDQLPMQPTGPLTLSSPQKAAIIIALLGEEKAGPIVELLPERQLRKFVEAFSHLKHIPRDAMLQTVAEFITSVQASSRGLHCGPEEARALAEQLFGEERAEQLFGGPIIEERKESSPIDQVWGQLQARKVEDIAAYLSTQRAEVVSLILSQFSTDKAGEILNLLPEDLMAGCIQRLSRKSEIDSETVRIVAELIEVEFLSQSQVDEGMRAIAFVSDILSILPSDRRNALVDVLENADPEQAEKIKSGMMTFEDLPDRLPPTAISVIFRGMEEATLIKALKSGAESAPKTTEFLYGNISQRMADQYKEQVEDMADVSMKEGEAAISAIMVYISKLEREGQITLIKPAPKDA